MGMRKRIDYLKKAVDDSSLSIVISQNLKFCEPYAYDAVITNEELKNKGCRVLHLEREFTPKPDGQLAGRLASFSEIV